MARSILIVDDHRPLAEMVAFLLRSEGYAVHLSHDGQAALDEAERNRPDLVLSDVTMPGMDGMALARGLRERGHLMAVVLMSAEHVERDDLPGVRYVPKPSAAADLLAIVREALVDAS
jgi:DNA-binding response OmpR family regulator